MAQNQQLQVGNVEIYDQFTTKYENTFKNRILQNGGFYFYIMLEVEPDNGTRYEQESIINFNAADKQRSYTPEILPL